MHIKYDGKCYNPLYNVGLSTPHKYLSVGRATNQQGQIEFLNNLSNRITAKIHFLTSAAFGSEGTYETTAHTIFKSLINLKLKISSMLTNNLGHKKR